jgi:hypothetical protein
VTTIIVLFNLKDAGRAAAYEAWATAFDMPAVRKLPSVGSFEVLRSASVLGGGTSPYQYFEIFRVEDMKQFGEDIATEAVQKMAVQFNAFADNPVFVVTEAL